MTTQNQKELADTCMKIIVETLKARCKQIGIEAKNIQLDVALLLINEEYRNHIEEALKDAEEAFGVHMPDVATLTFKASMQKAGNKVFDRYILIMKTAKKEAKKAELSTPSGV